MYGTTPGFFSARALRHNRISKTRCAPLCRPLRLTWALFTPGQTGNSISTNYHSFRKKDKCKRDPNRRCRHHLQVHAPWRNAENIRESCLIIIFLAPSIFRGRFLFIRFIVDQLVEKNEESWFNEFERSIPLQLHILFEDIRIQHSS